MQSWNLETLLVQITGQILDEGGREEGGSRLEVHLYLSHNMSLIQEDNNCSCIN